MSRIAGSFRILPWVVLGLAACLSLGASDPARDAAPPPSPPFTRPQNALFVDDFSGDSLKGWHADSLARAWSIQNGVLRGDLPDVKQAHSFLFVGDSTWTDYALDFDVCGMRGVDKGAAVHVYHRHGLGVDLRGPDHNDVLVYLDHLPVGSGKVENANGVWHHMRIEIHGKAFRVLVDGTLVVDHHLKLKSPPHGGGIVLAAYAGGMAQCTVYYDNVAVTPLAAKADP
jgi:hypothetical protein